MSTSNSSDLYSLQLQLKTKKIQFDEAIRNDKEFAQVKIIHLEIKELEKQLELWKEDNIDHSS
jgi:hypothetical protein